MMPAIDLHIPGDTRSKHRKDTRSNDPRRQARVDEFDKAGNRTALEEVEKQIARLEPGKLLLRGGGAATGVIGAAVELAGGASPGEVGAGVVGGAVGGAVGAAIGVAASTVPLEGLAAPAVFAYGGSVAGSAASKAAWGAWIPCARERPSTPACTTSTDCGRGTTRTSALR